MNAALTKPTVYLAEAGERYFPPYRHAIFDNREDAERWLRDIEPEKRWLESYDWYSVEEHVINEPEVDHV